MSASRGRTRLMEWIVRHSSEAFINARDRESGYTPLHRSIFYGQIHAAVALLKIGKSCHSKCPAEDADRDWRLLRLGRFRPYLGTGRLASRRGF